MSRKSRAAHLFVIALLASAAAIAGSAQVRPASASPGKDADAVALTTQLVKTGLYLIGGGGGNSLVRFSANGLIVVDGKRPGNFRPFMAKVRGLLRMSDLPVRFLILTDHHEDRAGNNTQFVAAGVRIIAHENVAHNLALVVPPGGAVAPPNITYDHDHTLRLGGVEARLLHFGNARTSGDTVVYFPNLKVVAVGDLYAATPDPDFAAGGSLVNWGAVLAEILKLDFDVVVPSAGPTVGRSDLEGFKKRIDTLVSRATTLVKNGVPKHHLIAQLRADDLGWRFDFTGDRLERFYAELSGRK
jgi:cyclase